MSLDFNNNIDQLDSCYNYQGELIEEYHGGLLFYDEPNFIINNEEYFGKIQDNIISQMEDIIISSHNQNETQNCNNEKEEIKNNKELKENNNNNPVYDINVEKTNKNTIINIQELKENKNNNPVYDINVEKTNENPLKIIAKLKKNNNNKLYDISLETTNKNTIINIEELKENKNNNPKYDNLEITNKNTLINIEELKENNNNKILNVISIEKTNKSIEKSKNGIIKKANKDKKKNKKKGNIDNQIRQAKIIIIKMIYKYINDTISEEYKDKKNIGLFYSLKKIDKTEIIIANKKYNIELMNKTMKEILSTKINQKYTFHPPNINEIVIKKLLNEKDEKKRIKFEKIFNKTLREWIHDLEDPKDKLKEIYEEELKLKNNKNELDEIIKNFEYILENKRERKMK